MARDKGSKARRTNIPLREQDGSPFDVAAVAGASNAGGRRTPAMPMALELGDAEAGEAGPPGKRGTDGVAGAPGAPGSRGLSRPGTPGIDGEDAPIEVLLPGRRGPKGDTGAAGAPGSSSNAKPRAVMPLALELDEPTSEPQLPGRRGAQGAAGGGGSPGPLGARGRPGMPGVDADDPIPEPLIPGRRGPAGSASSSSAPVARLQAANVAIAGTGSLYVTGWYAIPNGQTLEIAESGVMEIG